ncbi:MAG: hypothetical protein V1765_02375 [bacterium]
MPINMEPIGQRALPDDQQPAEEHRELVSRLAVQEQATGQAIDLRRKQRWVFYVIIVIMFLGALFLIVKVYNDNSKLLANIETATVALKQKDTDLASSKQEVTARDQQLQAADASLELVQADLQQKNTDLQTAVENNNALQAELTVLKNKLAAANANVANLVLLAAVKVSKTEADKIALADTAPDGADTDADGLSDELESILGTAADKSDSDNDGYSDKAELIGGFNPVGAGKLALDNKVASKYKEKIILQDNKIAWYVAANNKKYFLGTLTDKFGTMRYNPYWTRS